MEHSQKQYARYMKQLDDYFSEQWTVKEQLEIWAEANKEILNSIKDDEKLRLDTQKNIPTKIERGRKK